MVKPICIPSKGRPKGKTAQLLREAGIPFTLFVEPEDFHLYAAAGETGSPGAIHILPEDDQGIAYVRNYILDEMRRLGHQWFWMVDDDLRGFYEVREGRCHKVSPEVAFSGAQEIIINIPGVAQGSMHYQQFAWSAGTTFQLNTGCDVCVMINTQLSKLARYDQHVQLKEDRDFTLQLLTQGHRTARVNKFAYESPELGSNEGGLYSVYAEDGAEARQRDRMVAKWGNTLCEPVTKPSGRPDVKIKWNLFRH